MSKSSFNIPLHCRLTSSEAFRSRLRSRCRSSGVESESSSTIYAVARAPAPIPTQRAGPRATFRSRGPTFVGRRLGARGAEKLSTFEPTRHRNRPKAFRTGVRPYESTPWPAWQPDRTNWCHGSPAEHAWSLLARGQPPSSPDGRGRPNRQSSPLMATFLMLSRSRGAIGRVRATPGALSMAGRTTDGPDGRTDGSPGVGKGLRENVNHATF